MRRICVDFNEVDTWFNRIWIPVDETLQRGEKVRLYDADGNEADATVFISGDVFSWLDLDKFYPAVVD